MRNKNRNMNGRKTGRLYRKLSGELLMKIVFAPDSFKGTLSAFEITELLTGAAEEIIGDCEIIGIPAADGGEGTTEAVIRAAGGQKIYTPVHDPLMKERQAYFGRINEKAAIMEMAQASGLTLIPEEARNPLETTSYGTGELLKTILDAGYTDIYLSIGGSATNDGGMGFASALGIKFYDKGGSLLPGKGAELEKVDHIDMSGLCDAALNAKITVLCDVDNPLCGKKGATHTYGKQKGGTPEMLERLERGMQNYAEAIRRETGTDPDSIPGSGAAGGLGAALAVYLNAGMEPGIDTVLKLTDFDEKIKGADLIVTGEGRSDRSSVYGKVVCGVGEHALKAGIPVYVLCGSLGEGYEELYRHGIKSFITAVDAPMSEKEAFERAKELVYKAAVRLFRMVRS